MEIHYLKNILPDGGLCAVTEYGEHNINGSLHPTDDAHIHDYCEVYFNVSGNVSFAVENKVYPVNTGDIIISKPNEIHYLHLSLRPNTYLLLLLGKGVGGVFLPAFALFTARGGREKPHNPKPKR